MNTRRGFVGSIVTGLVLSFILTGAASAAPTAEGKEWRELYTSTGLTWAEVAMVCPIDGITPCSGTVGGRDLTGWVWGTAGQVTGLLDDYWPGIATADPPVITGGAGFWPAIAFLGQMRWTTFTSLTYSYSEFTAGWTASKDAAGLPIGAGASFSTQLTGTTSVGSLGLGSSTDDASPYRGVFLWRTAGLDYTAPVVTPTVTGTLGSNGWYRSDVALSWTVTDPESPIVSTTGCEPAALTADSAGSSYSCTAMSGGSGGPGTASVVLKRDALAPTITCGAVPTFAFGATGGAVSATVTDTMSGAASSSTTVSVPTDVAGLGRASVSGSDQAGNAGYASCRYRVLPPKCNGKAATIVGTAGNDGLSGTTGNDVIVAIGGADRIDGGPGNDSIRGDSGNDRCTSGEIRMSSCAVIY
ncbi:MAG TPA: hypothetical protein VIH10_15050 [Kribbella sp.]